MMVSVENLTDSKARVEEISLAWDFGYHKFYR